MYLLERQPWTVSRHRVSKVVCFSQRWTHLSQESRPPIGVGSNPVTASTKTRFNSAHFQCYLQGLIYLNMNMNMNMNMGTCTFCHDWAIGASSRQGGDLKSTAPAKHWSQNAKAWLSDFKIKSSPPLFLKPNRNICWWVVKVLVVPKAFFAR